MSDLRDDSGNRKQKSDNAPVSRRVATGYPAKRNDGDGLDVADYGTAHSAGFVDDVELGYVDHARTEPALYPVYQHSIMIGTVQANLTRRTNIHPFSGTSCKTGKLSVQGMT